MTSRAIFSIRFQQEMGVRNREVPCFAHLVHLHVGISEFRTQSRHAKVSGPNRGKILYQCLWEKVDALFESSLLGPEPAQEQ